jgi:hypothetical protein
VRPTAAVALLAALAVAALLADRLSVLVVLTVVLLAVCLRAPRGRRRLYLLGTLISAGGLFVLTPLFETLGSHPV